MAMVVKNNMTAINTLNTLNKNSSALSKSLQKVSSGMKINSAADDASGYAISERMRVQIRSLDQANQNTQNGSSMMKVAEGAVSSTVEILKTLKEKAVNAANDSNTDSDRQTIQKELDQSIDQINDNANVTFNGKYLVDGSKNTLGKATYTALSNQSLKEGTTGETKLTDLAARNGDSLEIHDTDKVTVSYVQGGKTYSTTFNVKDEKTGEIATLQDIFNKAEDIDKDSEIFANDANANVMKAEGKTDTEIASAKSDVITKKADVDAKLTALKATGTAADAKAALDEAVKGLKSALEAYNATQTASAKDVSTANLAALAQDDYFTGLENVAASGVYSNISDDAGVTNAMKAVSDAMSAWNGVGYASGASASNMSKAGADATGGAEKAQYAYDTALADYRESGGQAHLLTGNQVGYAASDDAVYTASGQKAITVTANTAAM